ncbi:hypothetical protein [Pantoea septica]|uniref:hypothetical protein n=1 Tax=Pantoea septica TaxID=472695 RepID=UPI0025DB1297|nr:hypothetical protein [Pantoea septica]
MLLLAVQTGLSDSDEPADAASIELKNSQRASAYALAFFSLINLFQFLTTRNCLHHKSQVNVNVNVNGRAPAPDGAPRHSDEPEQVPVSSERRLAQQPTPY